MKQILMLLLVTAASLTQTNTSQHSFKSPDATFTFRYPRSLVLCQPQFEHSVPDPAIAGDESVTRLVGWTPDSCGAVLPICPGLSLGVWESGGLVQSDPIVCVAYPRSEYEGTNFDGAAFSVSTISDSSTRNDCLENRRDHQRTHWETIGGVKFKASVGGDGAMSAGSVSYVYVTFHSGHCYNVEITEAYITSTAYDPETYKQMEFKHEKKVRRTFRSILNSFRFLK